ncbi:MAG: hypothetical protein K6A44_05160 [bacterium]|nr:hypothetical protein [bacterium]
MEAQNGNLLSQFEQLEGLSLDFNNDGKIDIEDYNVAIDYMKKYNTDKAFGIDKKKLDEAFTQFISETSSQDDNAAIAFQNGENVYHFYEDRDNNGVLDDKSELLGAKSGWDELKAYDLDGDGKIDGDELNNLRVLKINSATGEYEFMTAKDAGISEIDLTSLAGLNAQSIEKNLSQMSLDIKMLDGSVLSAIQNEEVLKTIEEYSSVFGAKITDYDGMPDDLSYMENFVNKMDIQGPIEGV